MSLKIHHNNEIIDFDVYDLDNVNSIKKRIASEIFKMPEEFIAYKRGTVIDFNTEIKDIETIITLSEKTNIEIKKIQESKDDNKQKRIINVIDNVLKKFRNKTSDLILMFLYHNIELRLYCNNPLSRNPISKLFQTRYNLTSEHFTTFISNEEAQQDFLEQVKENTKIEAKNVKNLTKILKSFQDLNVVNSTEFHNEKTTYTYDVDVKGMTLLELFNKIVLTEQIPFSSCNNYYKLLKEFNLQEEWLKVKENVLVLKYNCKKRGVKEYINLVITEEELDEDLDDEEFEIIKTDDTEDYNKEYKYHVEFRTNVGVDNYSCDEIIRDLNTVLSNDIEFLNKREKTISGLFLYPIRSEKIINMFIMSEIFMNNNMCSAFVNVDESQKATKRTKEHGFLNIYCNIVSLKTKRISASVSMQRCDKKIPFFNEININDKFLRIKCRGTNNECINSFRSFFGRLLSVYYSLEDELTREYIRFIPSFKTEEIADSSKKQNLLKHLNRELFVPNYSRKCHPVVLGDEKDGHLFPRNIPTEGKVYPSDGLNQQFYKCVDPKFPHFGIIENTLENSELYPVLPACYKAPQTDKPLYKSYYENKDFETTITNTTSVDRSVFITTKKIVNENVRGNLPDNLTKLFGNLYSDKAVRLGATSKSNRSLISCLIKITDNINISVNDVVKTLAKSHYALLNSQSTCDLSSEMYHHILKNKYISPQYFQASLEQIFKINIVVMNSSGFVRPIYTNGYYRFDKYKNVVFIYEHMGSESDKAIYPQYELIVIPTENDNTVECKQIFSKEDNKIYELFYSTFQTFALTKHLEVVKFKPNFVVESQVLDSKGKVRMIRCSNDRLKWCLTTSPMCPLFKVDVSTDLSGIELSDYQRAEVELIIRATETNVELSINETVLSPSKLEIYQNNKRIARYLLEYSYWTFSKLLNVFFKNVVSQEEVENNLDTLIKLYNSNHIFIIGNNVNRVIKGKKFLENTSFYEEKNDVFVLKIESEEVLERLIYSIKLMIKQNLDFMFEYGKFTYIQNYYTCVADFDTHPSQVVLYSKDDVMKWVNKDINNYFITQSINVSTSDPYFIHNPIISDEIFLAQNSNTIEQAVHACKHWLKTSTNIGVYAIEEPYEKAKLYKMISSTQITVYNVVSGNDQEIEENVKVIGFVVGENIVYTSILKL